MTGFTLAYAVMRVCGGLPRKNPDAPENRIKYMVTGTGIGAGKLDSEDLLALNVKLPSLIEQKKMECSLQNCTRLLFQKALMKS